MRIAARAGLCDRPGHDVYASGEQRLIGAFIGCHPTERLPARAQVHPAKPSGAKAACMRAASICNLRGQLYLVELLGQQFLEGLGSSLGAKPRSQVKIFQEAGSQQTVLGHAVRRACGMSQASCLSHGVSSRAPLLSGKQNLQQPVRGFGCDSCCQHAG